MISKELLREVMGIHIAHCSECKAGGDLFYTDTDGGHYINIYELAHKCKEWATENKYTILTENMYPNGYFAYVLSNKESIENYGYLCENKVIKDIPHNKTEPEAIFKACEYILNSIKQ